MATRKAASSAPPYTADVKVYGITIYCHLAQINTERVFNTDVELDAFIKDVLANGYADNKPGRTSIYPAHTIHKIDVAIR